MWQSLVTGSPLQQDNKTQETVDPLSPKDIKLKQRCQHLAVFKDIENQLQNLPSATDGSSRKDDDNDDDGNNNNYFQQHIPHPLLHPLFLHHKTVMSVQPTGGPGQHTLPQSANLMKESKILIQKDTTNIQLI